MKIQAARFQFIFVLLSIILGVVCAYEISSIVKSVTLARDTNAFEFSNSNIAQVVNIAAVEETEAEELVPNQEPGIVLSNTPSASQLMSPFRTLPAGSSLPAGEDCAVKIARSVWEPRQSNALQNMTKGKTGARIDGASARWSEKFAGRVDGNFTGTTDEILQWGGCKWGFDIDTVRAVAVQESWWRMSTVGDSSESYGIMQVRNTYHKAAFPMAQESTAFNVDYALAWRRACYDGDFRWMKEKNSSYIAGDEWGCIGAWFSGNWYDGDISKYWSGANWYIEEVKTHKSQKTWLKKDFSE